MVENESKKEFFRIDIFRTVVGGWVSLGPLIPKQPFEGVTERLDVFALEIYLELQEASNYKSPVFNVVT